ncbi:MAG: hypothetical protein ACAI35_25615 [Candidatus Methylacidiphilales bacterium]|nr:hypothetical protein [Candidatus Methylacidiphilales bacterium]
MKLPAVFGMTLTVWAVAILISFAAASAQAERPHAATILAPPPKVPIPPQGEVPTGNPAKLPPARPGSGEYFIGHRFYGEKEAGWGWIKKPDEKWSDAKWCSLKEKPGSIVAPYRLLPNRWDDHNHEYKLWGYWADYTAYDPYRDKNWPVFVLKGYESLGPQEKLKLKPSTGRSVSPSRASSSR